MSLNLGNKYMELLRDKEAASLQLNLRWLRKKVSIGREINKANMINC
jgi:hypothetical protein